MSHSRIPGRSAASHAIVAGVVFLTCVAVSCALAVMADEPESLLLPQVDTTEQLPATPVARLNPARIEGHEKCVDCHRSEYVRWLDTYHANESFDMLRTTSEAIEFARDLGMTPGEVTKSSSLCVNCHATPQIDSHGRARVIAGVSCEACHGASGGDQGWLNRHAVYGPRGSTRKSETESHRMMRQDRCQQAGMNTSQSLFHLAVACYRCHIVWSEPLVNTTRHPTSSAEFDFVVWATGEVRHNFHTDQSRNQLTSTLQQERSGEDELSRLRVMQISGQLARLHVGLDNLGRANGPGTFASGMRSEVDSAIEEVKGDLPPENPQATLVREALGRSEALIAVLYDELGAEWSHDALRDELEAYDASDEKQAALEDLKVAVTDSRAGLGVMRINEELPVAVKEIRASFSKGDMIRAATAARERIAPVEDQLGILELRMYESICGLLDNYQGAEGDLQAQDDEVDYFQEIFAEDSTRIEFAAALFDEAHRLVQKALERIDPSASGDAYVQTVKAALEEIERALIGLRATHLRNSAARIEDVAETFARNYDGSELERSDQKLADISTDADNLGRHSDEFKSRSNSR